MPPRLALTTPLVFYSLYPSKWAAKHCGKDVSKAKSEKANHYHLLPLPKLLPGLGLNTKQR